MNRHAFIPQPTNRKLNIMAGLLIFLNGCMVGPDYRKPETALPANWRTALVSPGETGEQAIEQQWWRHFHDPVLDQLIAKATHNNPDVRLGETRIIEARAARASAFSTLLPTGNLMGSASRQGNQLGFPSGGPANLSSLVKQPFNIFKSGFDASWELDLFGGHRRELESAEAELTASAISREDVLISTLAEVARTYLDIRLYQAQLAVTADVVASDARSAAISGQRFETGDTSGSDVSRDTARLRHDQAQIAYYRNLLAQAEYGMDVLLGESPGAAHAMLAAAAPVPAGDSQLIFAAPAQVIANRPDIRYAERKLAAATAQQGVAVAKFFPDVSLSGFIGLFNTNAGNFLNAGSKSWFMGASVLWPILSYGTLSANLDAADARQQEALTQYQKTIITALSDVERSFTAYSEQEKYLQSVEKETADYLHLQQIALERYRQGLTAYADVLDADRSLYTSRNQLNQARAQTAQNLIAVYKSLGGGWKQANTADVTVEPDSTAERR
ncbi:MAG: efflux transporter outer membrane subunit [Methylococcales bacterium]|nr:efflux transporter outer membrane subunit [Methylococcales bacterium]